MAMPMRWEEPETLEAVVEIPAAQPLRRPRVRKRRRMARGLFRLSAFAGLGLLGITGVKALLPVSSSPTTLSLTQDSLTGTQVALQAAKSERHLGFVTVTGNVVNKTTANLPKVETVVELLNAQNQTVQVESGMLAFDPLPSGQSVPFRVEMTDATNAVSYRVRFKHLMGGSLH